MSFAISNVAPPPASMVGANLNKSVKALSGSLKMYTKKPPGCNPGGEYCLELNKLDSFRFDTRRFTC